MSFDLYAWKRPVVESTDEASDLIEDEDAFEPSADLLRFYDEVLSRWPALESYSEDEIDDAPTHWSVTPERSDRLVEMSFTWSVPGEVLDTIVELARRYELVLYDPQGPDFHSPEPPEPMRRDPLILRAAVRGLLIGGAVAVGGWFLPIPVLDWILVVIGAFLVVMSVYSVVVWLRE